MVLFLSTDGVRCDSVNGQSTVPSKPIQMDVKVPVQPSILTYCEWGPYWGLTY